MAYRDHPDNILGVDSANNQFASTNVAANADGSMIERLEYIQGLVAAISAGAVLLQDKAPGATNSTTVVVLDGLAGYGDDFFNNQFYLQVLHNDNSAGNAPEKEVRKITDYTSATGSITCDPFSSAIEENDLCIVLHESMVAIGRDDNNNVFASTNVVANADGTVLERLEAIQQKLGAVDAADNPIGANDADNQFDSSAVVGNEDGSILERLEDIKDKVSGTDSAATVLGANDNNNGFASDQVASNADGSVLERLEDLKDRIDTVDDYVDGALLEKLSAGADGAGNFPATVVDGSVISKVLSKVAGGDTSSYDETTDSLEAISDKIGTPAGADVSADILALDTKLGTPAGADMATDIAALDTKIGTPAADLAADIAAIKAQTDELGSAVGASLSADIAAIDTKIGTPAVDLATDMASINTLIGTPAGADVSTDIAAIQSAVDAFAAAGGDGKAVVRKTVTFANTAADVNLFTITAGVNFKLYAFVTTNVESAAGCNIGVDLGATAIIADTDCTTLEANDVWHDATPDAAIELESVHEKYTAYGGTIVLDVEGAKQVDSGVIVFVCVYTPLTADGVVAAA